MSLAVPRSSSTILPSVSILFLLVPALAAAQKPAEPKAAPAEAAPAEAAPPSDDDCLSCHTDPSTTRADGKPVLVDADKFKGSIHGEVSVACVDCHADLAKAEFPHAEKLAPAQCTSCHEKEVTGWNKGIHSKLSSSDGKKHGATCVSCHGPAHEILPSGDRRSRTHHLNLMATCAKCHDDAKLIAAVKLPSGIVEAFQDSIHGRALNTAGLVVAPNCSSCHGAHDVRPPKDPESSVNRSKQAATCGTCHEGITEKFVESIHGKKVAEGDKKAPICADCHTAHSIQRGDAVAWELDVIEECGTCHEQSLDTYRDTFHGRVTELGFTRVAKCADCHSAHDIVPKKDPRSRVNPANLLATCKTCHANATPSFTKYDPHAQSSNRKRSASLFWVALGMKGLLAGVFGFFGFHTALWLGRSLHDRRQRRREAELKNQGEE